VSSHGQHPLHPPLRVTEAALAILDLQFQHGEKPSLRISLSFMYESGPRLDIAPDVATAADTNLHLRGLDFRDRHVCCWTRPRR